MVATQYSVSLVFRGHGEGECIKDNKTYSVGFFPHKLLERFSQKFFIQFHSSFFGRIPKGCVSRAWEVALPPSPVDSPFPLPLITPGSSSWRGLCSPQSGEDSTQQPLALALKTFHHHSQVLPKLWRQKMSTCRAHWASVEREIAGTTHSLFCYFALTERKQLINLFLTLFATFNPSRPGPKCDSSSSGGAAREN